MTENKKKSSATSAQDGPERRGTKRIMLGSDKTV